LVGKKKALVERSCRFNLKKERFTPYFIATDTMKRPVLLSNRALLRTGFYVGLLLIPIVFSLVSPERGSSLTLFGVTFKIAFLFAAWVEHVLVLNRFLDRRQYVGVVLGTMGAFLAFPAARFILEQYLTEQLFGATNYFTDDLTVGYYVADNQTYALTAIGCGLVFKLVEDWFRHQQERRALLSEKTTAELAFLKSQINPHFLFNTLNNIYALAYTRSDAAPGAILKLSELMRYMLYDSAGPVSNTPPVSGSGLSYKVSLSKEVQHLRNLVDLETLRVPNAQVEFTVEGNTDLYRIEPLLLISFVENAFKHGTLTDPAHPLVIHLSIRQGKLLADVVNKKNTHQKDAVGGVGLPNVRRRLDLLYPNQYVLRIDDDNLTYSCRLELTL